MKEKYTWRGHTEKETHTKGTYIWREIYIWGGFTYICGGHTNREDINIGRTYTWRGHTHKRIYTRRGHTHGGIHIQKEIDTERHTHVETETLRRHTYGRGIYMEGHKEGVDYSWYIVRLTFLIPDDNQLQSTSTYRAVPISCSCDILRLKLS